MANSTTAAPAPLQAPEEFSQKEIEDITVVITCACMLLICLCFITAATKHRLWHDDSPIDKLHKFVLNQILDPLMDLAPIYLLTDPPKNIYLVWGVILMIADGALTCIADAHTLSDSRSNFTKLFFIGLLSYNLIGSCQKIHKAEPFSYFVVINLWAIWAVIILKTVEKFFSFWVAKRAYGTADRTNFISDYMRLEHTLSTETPDPVSMRGYKYIVSGEDKVLFQTTITDDRQADVDIANTLSNEVVTVERVWHCRDQPLGRKMDSDGKLMDVCLSFALMKLLRRRFLDYTTEELKSKSTTLVLQGLLESEDKNRAFRVIRTELGFLKDLFYSHYPIIFGCGFPIYNYLLSLLLLGATGFLAKTAYSDANRLQRNHPVDLTDLYITYVLVAMIIMMEITETATYWLSDWNKVTLLINYVKFPWLHESYFISMALRFLCKTRFKQPVRDKIGQYSLLEQYGKFSIRAKLCNRRATCGNGVMKFCHASVKLPDEAKRMISYQLSQLSQGPLSNGESSLSRNGMQKLGWTCKLRASTQTILLWHIATCFCETIKPSQPSSGKEVATALSKYCAYLVVFVPDLLPDQGNRTKRVLDKVVSEISRLQLEGVKDESEMWKKIDLESREESTILGMGSELGKTLVESISDENERWRVLAEFWAEYLLYLAPSGNVEAHKESLGSGGEFITHLWVLLYHAGVLERPEIAPNP